MVIVSGPRCEAAETRSSVAVVIVSVKQVTAGVSSAELRRIFLGQITRWPTHRRIVLLVRPPEVIEQELLLHRIIRMSDIDYSQHWLGQVFRGQAAAPPRTIESATAMKKAVAEDPDAVGLLQLSDLEPADLRGLRVLMIDGKAPGHQAYVLKK